MRQQKEIDNGNRQRETEQSAPGGDGILQDVGSQREGGLPGRGNEILPSSPDVHAQREGADGVRSGIREKERAERVVRPSVLPTDPSGRGVGTEGSKNSKYNRSVPNSLEEQRSAITRIIDFAKNVKDRVERAVIGGITQRQVKDFAKNGIEVDDTWVHSLETSAVLHNQKHHGSEKSEAERGQIAITNEDYERIPEILESYDKVSKSSNTSHRSGNEVIIYEKEFEDGYVYYLEEKRDNRRSLAFQTMYKKRKGTDSSDGLMQNASTSTPLATSDNLNSNSENKDNALLSDKQENDGKSSLGERISEAEAEVNTNPTEPQKLAGNYKKGHVQVGTFDVTIENPKGSKRSGTDSSGRGVEVSADSGKGNAFDNKTPAKEKKKRKDAATRGTAGQPNAGARAVTPDLSDDKDNALPSYKQDSGDMKVLLAYEKLHNTNGDDL